MSRPGARTRWSSCWARGATASTPRSWCARWRDASRGRARLPGARASLGSSPRRRRGAHARSRHRPHAQPMAPLPDARLADARAHGLLSVGRRDRLPRPAAGRAGAPPRRARPGAGASPRLRRPPVRGRRRPALVAPALRSRGADALLGRSAVAAVRRARATSRRRATPRSSTSRCPFLRGRPLGPDEDDRYARFEVDAPGALALRALRASARARHHARAPTGFR